MTSNTRIRKRLEKKSDDYVVETVKAAKNKGGWLRIAFAISGAKKRYDSVNLKRIDEETSEGDTVIVIGKVLGSGKLNKKVRVCALSFSDSAREKLKSIKGEAATILEEIKKNPKAEGIKVVR
jgi:large subunit ribosomal protein L18e